MAPTSKDQKTQLKIYAMFMLADGESSNEEKEQLNSIYTGMNVDIATRREVLSFCKELPIFKGMDNSFLIIQQLSVLLSKSYNFTEQLNHNKIMQLETIWTLINLGYSDREFSEPEKKIIVYLAQKWGIKESILQEFIDTADTLLVLTNQKERLQRLTLPYWKNKDKISAVDENIQLMFENIKTTISEANAI